MRRLARTPLSPTVLRSLDSEQQRANELRVAGRLEINPHWKKARQHVVMKREVLKVLKAMAGGRVRCMYCFDSHGSDIEHFWPKATYPERMFAWPNLLLCCTACGNYKGDQFPKQAGRPLLIDPTMDDPWESLDFDPVTGIVTARFDRLENAFVKKGVETVGLLKFDEREGLAEGYRRSWLRITRAVERLLAGNQLTVEDFMHELHLEDEHGLVEWCFRYGGRSMVPFRQFRKEMPGFWKLCARLI